MADRDRAMTERAMDAAGQWGIASEDAESGSGGRWASSGDGKGRKRLTGSLAAKIAAFFLLVVSVLAGAGASLLCINLAENNFYTDTLKDVLLEGVRGLCMQKAHEAAEYLECGDPEGAAKVCEGGNIDIEMAWTDENGSYEVIWSTWDGYITELAYSFYYELNPPLSDQIMIDGHPVEKGDVYQFRVYVDWNFSEDDEIQRTAQFISWAYGAKYILIGIAALGIFGCAVCFIFLMCSAGHRNGQEGIVPGVLTNIPVDMLTILFGGVGIFILVVGMNLNWYANDLYILMLVFLMAAGAVLTVWITVYCMEIALRLKLGNCLRNSITYMALRGIWRVLRFLGRGIAAIVRGIPLILTTMICYLGICILELLGVVVYVRGTGGFLLWAAEKIALFVIISYIALVCHKLLTAGRALAEGQENYMVDTSRMIGDFKEHGENLNSLSRGIARAVAERMKSEHLKTELITNVSHDLKTPLTSIINYADLLYEETRGGIVIAGGAAQTAVHGEAEEDTEAAGREAIGQETAGQEAIGQEVTGREAVGQEIAGQEAIGQETAGQEAVGQEAIGQEATGREAVGQEAAGREAIGQETTGQEAVGRKTAGREAVGQEAAGQETPDKGSNGQNARIAEYAEVLLRQSRRLKKLLEDLMEASKATTGNLEVNLQPCEVGVLLSQAVGEYQQRMEEKGLELIARQPEEPVNILADGRHLWRVFDNLLNNICKYAQEHSRVYLSLEVREGRALLIFRNMSKYPLDISSEELEERFVRGDRSRHMEGNGLGLSIARSLVDLQNGKMEIVIDGDLFKVVLEFAVYR